MDSLAQSVLNAYPNLRWVRTLVPMTPDLTGRYIFTDISGPRMAVNVFDVSGRITMNNEVVVSFLQKR
jgi:hypothetical protein